jgi:hypothetical protein
MAIGDKAYAYTSTWQRARTTEPTRNTQNGLEELPHRVATHSIHFAIPPASSMTFPASAYASWHRAQAAKDAGGSKTLVGRFIRMLAIVAARSRSTSFSRRRSRCGVAAGRRTMWPGDRWRRAPSVHHALRWQIGRVGFQRPFRPAEGAAPRGRIMVASRRTGGRSLQDRRQRDRHGAGPSCVCSSPRPATQRSGPSLAVDYEADRRLGDAVLARQRDLALTSSDALADVRDGLDRQHASVLRLRLPGQVRQPIVARVVVLVGAIGALARRRPDECLEDEVVHVARHPPAARQEHAQVAARSQP